MTERARARMTRPEQGGVSKNPVPGSPGRPLDAATRAALEPRFGFDFSGVRVHTDAAAAESARAIHARAYTIGQTIVFGAGQFQPGTARGRRLLVHELTHVVQQRAGTTDATPRPRILPPDSVWESEARRIADTVQSTPAGPDVSTLAHDPARGATRASPPAGIIARDVGDDVIPVGARDPGGRALERARHHEPALRPYVPSAPPMSWAQRVQSASVLAGSHRAAAYIELLNEALASDAALFPELSLPVVPFRSDETAAHGDVALDGRSPSQPGRPGLRADTRTHRHAGELAPRVFIVLTPGAIDPDAGPDFTRRTLHHEYVHFLQNVRGELTVRPDCRATWRGVPVGGNPNREVLAVSTTFARFFPAWGNTERAAADTAPWHILEDLQLLQASFRCADDTIRTAAVERILASVGRSPRLRAVLLGLLRRVAERAVPSMTVRPSDDAMRRLANALGEPLGTDPRLPVAPGRPGFEPLFDQRRFIERSSEQMRERVDEPGQLPTR